VKGDGDGDDDDDGDDDGDGDGDGDGDVDPLIQAVRRCTGIISGCAAAAKGRGGWQGQVELALDIRLSMLRTVVNLCNNNAAGACVCVCMRLHVFVCMRVRVNSTAAVDVIVDRRLHEPVCAMLQHTGQVRDKPLI